MNRFFEGYVYAERALEYQERKLTENQRYCVKIYERSLEQCANYSVQVWKKMKILYVHKNMEGTLFYLKNDNGYYFSTKPLDNGVWTRVPDSTAYCLSERWKAVFRYRSRKNIHFCDAQYFCLRCDEYMRACSVSENFSRNFAKPIDNIGKVCYNANIAYQSGRINKIRGNHHEQEL